MSASLALAWRASPTLIAARVATALVSGLAPVATAWLTKDILNLLVTRAPTAQVLGVVLALAVSLLIGSLMPVVTEFADAELSRRTRLTARVPRNLIRPGHALLDH